MKLIILFNLLFLSFSLIANTLPTSDSEFCKRVDQIQTVKNLSLARDNLIAFKNDGGLFNGGVCWWHSRFQRNTLYLVIIKPALPKPNLNEAIQIIKSIRNSNSVVVIPGYENFSDFTLAYQKEIQKELNNWQLYDGVVLGGWIDGIKGNTTISSDELHLKMNELHDYVSVKNKIAYEKLQIKGITSHAWLIVNTKSSENGLDIGFIDSNSPTSTKLYRYKFGDTSFNESGYGNFVPYLEFRREEEKINQVALNYCNKNITINLNESEYWDDLADFENNL